MVARLQLMSFSQAEIMALAGKAARGGGAPPAQAAQFGRAVVAHLAAGRDENDLCNALDRLPNGPIIELPAAISEIVAAGGEGAVRWGVPEGLTRSYVDVLPFAAIIKQGEIAIELDNPAPPKEPVRLNPSDNLRAQMARLAEKTFVPESDASRESGAGAGWIDND